MENDLLYQIYFNDTTKAHISAHATPLNNTWHPGKPLEPAFESHAIRNVFDSGRHVGYDRVGILSWAVEQKNWCKLEDFLRPTDADVTTCFWYNWGAVPYWDYMDLHHPGIISMAQDCLALAGRPMDLGAIHAPPIYQNAHVTKTAVYERYVREWLAPVMDVMFDPVNKKLAARLNQNSGYKMNLNGKPQYNKAALTKVTGRPYYTYHTVICELLFPTFLHMNPQYTVNVL